MALRSPEMDDWIERARAVDIVATAQGLGAALKRQGQEWIGPCPRCGGTDRFSVSMRKRIFNCGHQGGAGGDVIEMVRHIQEVDFYPAVELLAGPKPHGTNGVDHEALEARSRERRDMARDEKLDRAKEEAIEREKRHEVSAGLWADTLPIRGSAAEAYLAARCPPLRPDQCEDLRFVAALTYYGYANAEAPEVSALGAYPAMVAAIRDVTGNLIGCHRTFLDPARPRKLEPPGDRMRNRAKKVLGAARGIIRLSALWPCMAIGEGIETTLSWFALGRGPEEIGIAAGVSLGNISGSSTGTLPHPMIEGRVIANGEPDMERPGLELSDGVAEVILLGDGDSDPYATRARLLTAARRFRRQGRVVSVDLAGKGLDFNDIYLSEIVEANR